MKFYRAQLVMALKNKRLQKYLKQYFVKSKTKSITLFTKKRKI